MNLTARAVARFPKKKNSPELDSVAVEEPLEIRANGRPLFVTMRLPGDDLDLAAGFLFTEGFVREERDLVSLEQAEANIVEAKLARDPAAAERNFFASSSCGICGKAAIEHVFRSAPPVQSSLRIQPSVLLKLPDTIHPSQSTFAATGGTHAAGLFDATGNLLLTREDVGRHNAVDKIVGARFRAGLMDFRELTLFNSGRAGFEVVQKAAIAGIPVVCAVGAASSLAIDTATTMRMTLVGFLRGGSYVVYAGEERIGPAP